MPVLGSPVGILVFTVAAFAWAYLLYIPGHPQLLPLERTIAGIFSGYVLVGFSFSLAHLGLPRAWSSTLNNSAFLAFLPLMPVLRTYFRAYWLAWIRWSAALGGISAGLLAAYQSRVLDMPRAEGIVGNPLIFSYLAALLSLLNLILALDRRVPQRSLHAVAAVASLTALFFAGGRTALALYPLFGSALVVHSLLGRDADWRRLAVSGYIVLLSGIAGYELVRHSEPFLAASRRFSASVEVITGSGDAGADISLRDRVEMQKLGWRLFAAHPFAGHGRDRVRFHSGSDGTTREFTHFHNAYLTEAVASGVLGLLFYLAVLAAPILASWRLPAPGRSIGVTLAAFTAANATTNIGFYHDLTTSYFALAVIALTVGNSLPLRREDEMDEFKRHLERDAIAYRQG